MVGLGSAADVHPNVGLALALRKRGHDVLFVAPAMFRSLVQRVGLEFVEVLNKDECNAAIRGRRPEGLQHKHACINS